MGIFAFVDRYGYEVDALFVCNVKLFLPKNNFFEPCLLLPLASRAVPCEAPCNGERGISPKPPPGTVARARGYLRLLTDMDIKLTRSLYEI